VKFLRRLTLSKSLKIQIVELARTLIADEQHWCRRHLAEDGNGVSVSPISSSAVKRCGLGAVIAAAYQLTHDFDTAHKLGHEVLAPNRLDRALRDRHQLWASVVRAVGQGLAGTTDTPSSADRRLDQS